MTSKRKYVHAKTYNSLGEKWCNRCKGYHPLHEFGKSKSTKDGRSYVCSNSRVKYLKIRISKEVKIVIEPNESTPTLNSQVFYKYQRPDAYDTYINNKEI